MQRSENQSNTQTNRENLQNLAIIPYKLVTLMQLYNKTLTETLFNDSM